MTISQISIFLENRSGQLSAITKILSDNDIDIKALNIAETADYGVLRIITSHSTKTVEVLKNEGFLIAVNQVVAAAVPNTAGGLNNLLQILTDSKIDIEYMYSIFGQSEGVAYLIFKVKEIQILETILKANNIKMLEKSEIGID